MLQKGGKQALAVGWQAGRVQEGDNRPYLTLETQWTQANPAYAPDSALCAPGLNAIASLPGLSSLEGDHQKGGGQTLALQIRGTVEVAA